MERDGFHRVPFRSLFFSHQFPPADIVNVRDGAVHFSVVAFFLFAAIRHGRVGGGFSRAVFLCAFFAAAHTSMTDPLSLFC
jgi:hypothetical protein